MDPYVDVLLVEQDQHTISVLSLSLSEIRECRLQIASGSDEALLILEESKIELLLFSDSSPGRHGLDITNEIHHRYPGIYLIVSLPSRDDELLNQYFVAGANDCLIKDRNYVANLVSAVKRAFIRISEREAFSIAPMTRADQFAMDENLPDVIFSLDLEGRFLYVNKAVSSLLGYEQKDLINRPFVELIAPAAIRQEFSDYLSHAEYEINFRKTLGLLNSLGIEEDFECSFTLMEGEMISGVARKESMTVPREPMEVMEESEDDADQKPRAKPLITEEDTVPARLGPYRVVTLLGAGAMGRVYKGFDEQLERDIAIKVIRHTRASDKEYVDRFHHEAKILASICHPNIALIYFYGQTEGRSYFCMEYLAGGSLEGLLREKGILGPESAIAYAIQVAMGLKEAMEKGVIHLDIKPSNLMLADDDRVKVVDFGFAQRNRAIDASGKIVGTPLYIAPEQIAGGIADFRCDIYSLGITLFQMLYGFLPFNGTTTREVFFRKLQEDFPARSTLDPAVPAGVYDLVKRMAARDVAQRIGSYQELIQELEVLRRSLGTLDASPELVHPGESEVVMRGNLYDRLFPEILGEIEARQLSGKLTVSWYSLHKTIHFRKGKIIAVLSNQEGENFIDLVLAYAPAVKSKLPGASGDLFHGFSTAMQYMPRDVRQRLSQDLDRLSWRILEGMFSWLFGEFLFEEGVYGGQMELELSPEKILDLGVRNWMDIKTIQRRLMEGNCRVELSPDFQKLLNVLDLRPSDRFLLFRFEKGIDFKELLPLSGLAEEEFFRLIYFFFSLQLVGIFPAEAKVVRKATPVATPPAPSLVESAGLASLPQSAPPAAPRTDAGTAHRDLTFYYLNCATKSYEAKNYWACVEYCRKALDLRQDARIYRLMGKALATHLRFGHEAMEAYKKAKELDPENVMIDRDIAELYFVTGNFALARAKFQDLLKADPSNALAAKRLADIKKKKIK